MTNEEYDCRGICLNLLRSCQNPNLYKDVPLRRVIRNDKDGYFCSLTKKRCVGAIEYDFGILVMNDGINISIVERCPSRKTIDDVLKKQEERK